MKIKQEPTILCFKDHVYYEFSRKWFVQVRWGRVFRCLVLPCICSAIWTVHVLQSVLLFSPSSVCHRAWSSAEYLVSSFCSRWHHSAQKDPYALCPISQQSPQCCLLNSAKFFFGWTQIVTVLGGWNVSCFLFSLLSCMWSMLWCSGLSMFRKFRKPLGTSVLPGCRSGVTSPVCLFIPFDSGMTRAKAAQLSLQPKTVHGCMSVGADHPKLHLLLSRHQSHPLMLPWFKQ